MAPIIPERASPDPAVANAGEPVGLIQLTELR